MLWDTISRACSINNEEEKGPGRIPDESSAYTSNRPSAYFKQLTLHAHARLPADARRGSQGGGSVSVVKPLLSWPDKAEKN
jgi:hypothetical protein